MGKVTSDPKFGRKLLMLGIPGSVVQRERLSTFCFKLLEALDDRFIRLSSAAGRIASTLRLARLFMFMHHPVKKHFCMSVISKS
jgi:hypothetical protein